MQKIDINPLRLLRLHLERQAGIGSKAILISRVVAILLGLLLILLLTGVFGKSPLGVLQAAYRATFGSWIGMQQVLLMAAPIITVALSTTVAMKIGLWNIGGGGQLLMGAFAATLVGLYVKASPPVVLILMFFAGALGGALWILIPALARVKAGVAEIIPTLMMNDIALWFIRYFVNGPLRDPKLGSMLAASQKIPYAIPLFSGTQVHIGIFVPLVLAIILFLVFRYTTWGYEIKTIGGSSRVAEFAGIPVDSRMFTSMLLSGAIAGIAGMIEVAGTAHRLTVTIGGDYGFLGFITAAMANFSVLLIVAVGILYAAIQNIGIAVQTQGLSVYIAGITTGLILLLATIGDVISQYRLIPLRKIMPMGNDKTLSPPKDFQVEAPDG